jgi:hypothetical protein
MIEPELREILFRPSPRWPEASAARVSILASRTFEEAEAAARRQSAPKADAIAPRSTGGARHNSSRTAPNKPREPKPKPKAEPGEAPKPSRAEIARALWADDSVRQRIIAGKAAALARENAETESREREAAERVAAILDSARPLPGGINGGQTSNTEASAQPIPSPSVPPKPAALAPIYSPPFRAKTISPPKPEKPGHDPERSAKLRVAASKSWSSPSTRQRILAGLHAYYDKRRAERTAEAAAAEGPPL